MIQKDLLIIIVILGVSLLAINSQDFNLFSAMGNVIAQPLPGDTFQFTYTFGPEGDSVVECSPEEGCSFNFGKSKKTVTEDLRSPPWFFHVAKSASNELSTGNLNSYFPRLQDGVTIPTEDLMDVRVGIRVGNAGETVLFKPGEVKEINPFIRVQYRPVLKSRFENVAGHPTWVRDFMLVFRFQFDVKNGMRVRYPGQTKIQFRQGTENLPFALENDITALTGGIHALIQPQGFFTEKNEQTVFEQEILEKGLNTQDIPLNTGIMGITQIIAQPTVNFFIGEKPFVSLRGGDGSEVKIDLQPRAVGFLEDNVQSSQSELLVTTIQEQNAEKNKSLIIIGALFTLLVAALIYI